MLRFRFRYENTYCSGVLTFDDFLESTFIVVANLEKLRVTEGALSVKLRFSKPQDEKIAFIWMPVNTRTLIIDRNLEVTVE